MARASNPRLPVSLHSPVLKSAQQKVATNFSGIFFQAGDLRPYLSGFFDTMSGTKASPSAYKNIALSIGADAPSQLLFATGGWLLRGRRCVARGRWVRCLRPCGRGPSRSLCGQGGQPGGREEQAYRGRGSPASSTTAHRK